MAVSKTQIDRLGDRLKAASHTDDDLRLLDDYRRSFGGAYDAVIQKIRECGGTPTGRLAKSTLSIVQKLNRESMRLTQMQDIAGCRVVVDTVVEQNQFVDTLKTAFSKTSVTDRRDKPSFGYRAVHVIVEMLGKPVEIQVRTSLQHQWAELSEKYSDVIDPAIKYGGGPSWSREFLTELSESVAGHDELEAIAFELAGKTEKLMELYDKAKERITSLLVQPLPDRRAQELRNQLKDFLIERTRFEQADEERRAKMNRQRKDVTELLRMALLTVQNLKAKQA